MARDFASGRVALGDIALDAATQFYFSAWVNSDTLSTFNIILSKFLSTSSRIEIQLGGAPYGDSNEILIVLCNGSTADLGYTTGLNLVSTATWHHILVAYDGGGAANADRLKLYWNGSAKSLSFNGTIPATMATNAASADLGARTGSTSYWDGKIAEVAMWVNGLPGGIAAADAAAMLADGVSPAFLRKNGLHYLPLFGRSSPENSIWSTTTGTVTNATQSAHPPMRYPGRVQSWTYGAAAPATIVGPLVHSRLVGRSPLIGGRLAA